MQADQPIETKCLHQSLDDRHLDIMLVERQPDLLVMDAVECQDRCHLRQEALDTNNLLHLYRLACHLLSTDHLRVHKALVTLITCITQTHHTQLCLGQDILVDRQCKELTMLAKDARHSHLHRCLHSRLQVTPAQ